MSLSFPLSPALNQTYTAGTKTWSWNGTAWVLLFSGITGLTGATGAGFTGATGVAGVNGATGVAGVNGATGVAGVNGAAGVAGPVAGSNTQVIFNDAGVAGGSANLTFNKTTNLLTTSILNVSGLLATPTPAPTVVEVSAWGGGGAAGGTGGGEFCYGGGGGFAQSNISVTSNVSYTIAVGSGGQLGTQGCTTGVGGTGGTNGTAYGSGGAGTAAGTEPCSGTGGGGGAASLFLNSTTILLAAAGGGGAGGREGGENGTGQGGSGGQNGNNGDGTGATGGTSGAQTTTIGQSGTLIGGDHSGSGGGGGGYLGGNAGLNPTNDGASGGGGGGGSNYGTTTATGTYQLRANSTSSLLTGYSSVAVGGSSGNAGGSGIVIIRYADTYAAAQTTGNVSYTVSGGYRTYSFTSTGTINFQSDSIQNSTSTTTGSLIVGGGAGIAKDVFVGGNLYTPTANTGLVAGTTGSIQTYAGSFNGTSQYLTVNNTPNDVFSFGTGDFTVEAWVYLNSYNTDNSSQIVGGHSYGSNADWILSILGVPSGADMGKLSFVGTNGNAQILSTSIIPLTTGTHVAFSMVSGVGTLYINGIASNSGTMSGYYGPSLGNGNTIVIGCDSSGNPGMLVNGLISNLRVVKGLGVYTTDFVPSTNQLTATQAANINGSPSAAITGTQTSLLTLQNATFIDNSVNAWTFTNTGTVTIAQQTFTVNNVNSLAYNGAAWQSAKLKTDKLTVPVTGLRMLGGSSNYVLKTDGYGNLNWVIPNSGATGPQGVAGPIAGLTRQIIFNDASTAAGNANLTFNKSTNALTVANGNLYTPTNNTGIVGSNNYGLSYVANLSGSSQYLSVTSSTLFKFGTLPFTIEGWFFLTNGNNKGLFQLSATGLAGSAGLGLAYTGGFQVLRGTSTNTGGFHTGVVDVGTWFHAALVRTSANILTVYINGVGQLVNANDTTNYNFTTNLIIGGYYSTSYLFPGYISNFRIVNGVAVYLDNFTVPTGPLTATQSANPFGGTNTQAITGTATSLLTLQNAAFVDNSTNALPVTPVGTVSVIQQQVPFSTSSTSGTVTAIGQGYAGNFNGTNQYLSIPTSTTLNFSTGTFNIEAWIYPTSLASTWYILSASGSGGFFFGFNSTAGAVGLGCGRVGIATWDYTSGVSPPINTWSHVAISRTGSSLRIFLNGIQIGVVGVNSTAYDASVTSTQVGAQGANYYFPGYISNLRVVKGIAVYTGNFAVPISSLTALASANPYGGSNTAAVTGVTTSLLTLQNPTIVDNSTNAFTITNTGTVITSLQSARFGGAAQGTIKYDGSTWQATPIETTGLTVPIGGLRVSGGSSGYILSTNGANTLSWIAQSSGSGGGTIGATGIQGYIGATGPAGSGGTGTGATGATGTAGNIGATGAGTITSRSTVSSVTSSLANGTTDNINLTGFKGYTLYKIQVTAASWVRIYSSTAARSSDSGRSSGTDPASDAGVITEIITIGSGIVTLTPAVLGFNDETVPTTTIPIAVTNNSGATATITVTLTLVKTEE